MDLEARGPHSPARSARTVSGTSPRPRSWTTTAGISARRRNSPGIWPPGRPCSLTATGATWPARGRNRSLRSQPESEGTVDIAAVADVYDEDLPRRIINMIEDAVISHPFPVEIPPTLEFL